jgi:PAS domain S-box-containing protein
MPRPAGDLTAALAGLADVLLDPAAGGDAAARALERLRQRAGATDAVFWLVSDGRAHRALHTSARADARASMAEQADATIAIAQLRVTGTVMSRFGDLSGVEDLVPDGVGAFVVTAASSGEHVSGALVLGWSEDAPHCTDTVVTQLRIAAAMLTTALAVPREAQQRDATFGDEVFRDLADSVPVPIWIATPDGRLRYGNTAWREATGTHLTAPRDFAALWIERAHPDDRLRAMSEFEAAVCRRDRFAFEVRVKAGDGTYHHWSFVAVPRLAPDGSVEHYVGAGSDITATRHSERALHELGARLVAAQETERSRIARELHDDVGQQLALLASQLDVTRDRQLSRSRMLAGLSEARKSLQDVATTVHSLSHELHPAKLKLLGLHQTLDILCRNVATESAVVTTFDAPAIPAHVPDEAALCLYRVTQEALQNAVKHSGASRIDVTVTATPSQLLLRITDDGAGFERLASQCSGLGLLTMRERVELSGGTFRIDTSTTGGTTIEATVPLPDAL